MVVRAIGQLVVISAVATLALVTGVAIGDRLPPYEHDYGVVTPENPHEGGQVTITWIMKKINRICPGQVQRQLYSRTGALVCNYETQPAIRREQLMSQQDGVDRDRLARSFELCENVKAGPVTYRAYTCYQCNWLQKWYPNVFSICQYTPDVKFTIVPK